ncbi:MAG: MotA/TolQ/ExbB proton channel family protein [bacterium]|nr:MotA/TolQ/ExbB proton channel family protein [bacterium]
MNMKKMQKSVMAAMMMLGLVVAPVAAGVAMAQDAAPATQKQQQGGGDLVGADGKAVDPSQQQKSGGGFFDIVFGSGVVGAILWFALFADGAMAIYFAVDCFVLIKPQKLMPTSLITNVQSAMVEGDVMKALKVCENEPSAMSNILSTAFQHVEDGYDVIQEAVNGAADLETERLTQRLTWISVCSNLGPSLGLLGTVQGMILTFEALAQGGAGDASMLANSIGQALWTTAAGLCVSIPSITIYYSLRNKATRLIMRMTALTMELLKGLRNVEVVDENAQQA